MPENLSTGRDPARLRFRSIVATMLLVALSVTTARPRRDTASALS
jgi:hypothetical protein